MNIIIEAFTDNRGNYLRTALNIRFDIYTDELNIDKFREFDGLDKKATHYLIFIDKMPAGVCRWRKEKDYILIDRFGIKKEYRGNGYGVLLLKYVVNELTQSKKEIQILATEESVSFFNFLGFNKVVDELEVSGKKFKTLALDKKKIKNG